MSKYWFKIMTVIEYNNWQTAKTASGKEKALPSYYITAFEFICSWEKGMQHQQKYRRSWIQNAFWRIHTNTPAHPHPVKQCSWDVPTSIWPWKGHVKISFWLLLLFCHFVCVCFFHELNFSYLCEMYCLKGHVIVCVCVCHTKSHSVTMKCSVLFTAANIV